MPRVYSKRRGADPPPRGAIYVGRPTKWGNPIVLEREEDRAEVLRDYEAWLLRQRHLIDAAKRELKGKDLVCWCAPLPCHADVLLRIANED
jgi:hypothetical protein